MYSIGNKKDETIHWAAAIDEGYGIKPYIELNICINKKYLKYKLPLSKDNWEATAVAQMLRQAADEIERNIKIFEGRMRYRERVAAKQGPLGDSLEDLRKVVRITRDGALCCPYCDNQNEPHLHHGIVTIYNRREDAEHLVLTQVSSGQITTEIVPSRDRRHGDGTT